MTRPIPGSDWNPTSWQSRPATQQPNYPDPVALERALADLSRLPPIVTSWEIDALKQLVAKGQRGEAFILQGGDCEPDDFLIVSCYKRQILAIRDELSRARVSVRDVCSIDKSQGSEKNIVIMSTVRCNSTGNIGFVSDERRLNVGMTRARRALIVFGDQSTLVRKDPSGVWTAFFRCFL